MPRISGRVDEVDEPGISMPDTTIPLAAATRPASQSFELHSKSEPPSGMSPINNEDEDDASDVSMSAETVDSDDESKDDIHSAAPMIISQGHVTSSVVTGQKRKMPIWQASARGEDHKRLKLDLNDDAALASYRGKKGHLHADRSLLPAEIWHHIFTFTSPRTLGRLLQVNKLFRAYLDPYFSTSPTNLASLSISVTQRRAPEVIWQASRRLFLPGMPSPLQGLNEMDMWRLACTLTCEFCGRQGQPVSPSPTDQWHSGPGETGVSTVWPFAIRSCGSCLQQKTVKEIDLLLSSVPSPLMVALPVIFITDDLHIISSATLQNTHAPAQIAKLFFKPHVEDINKEFLEIKGMGSGTAEEWFKGLDKRGKEKRNEAFKWERWEQIGGVRRMQLSEKFLSENNEPQAKLAIATTPMSLVEAARPLVGYIGSKQQGPGDAITPSNVQVSQAEQHISALFSVNTPPRFDSPAQTGFSNYPPRIFQQPRHERTKEEVAELKAARRAEIERRCMLLDPPLTPAVLSHMGSFQAAIQIIKPLDDSAWEVLKPRLLSQREEAQQRENELVAQTRVVQEKYDERRQLDVHLKEVKEVNDREWDDIQAPLRARIGGYADEIIRDGWHGGEKVTKESSPRFAADVLIYVRKRFYAEVAKDEAAVRAAGHEPKADPPNGPYTQKLILENMKFVFDTKIKPLTEQYSKELFLCNGCENNFKFYGFEGVIQHYAAKHTSALSVGSIVVHWRAEWPEHPPFNAEPDAAINSFKTVAKPNTMFANGAMTSPLMQGFGGYPSVSGQTAASTQALQQPPGYQQNPAPYYGHSQYNDQYPIAQAGSFVQTTNLQGQSPAFQGPQYQGSQASGYQPFPGQSYPGQGFDGQFSNGTQLVYESPHPRQVYPVPIAEQPGQIYSQAPPFQTVGQFTTGQYPSGQYNPPPRPVVPVRTEAYKAQLYDVAQTARELWNHTAGIKDMPGSVRVHVILFHILQRYRAKYPDDPPLAMLIDGLSNNKDMRPVRNVNGLACRACKLTNGSTTSYKGSTKGSGTSEKKLFSLPQLLNHFQSTHIDGIESCIFDWTKDMVELPDNARISTLARAQGMDEHKMQLVSEALPEAFRTSLQKPEYGTIDVPYTAYLGEEEDFPSRQLAPSRDEHERFYASEPQGRYPDSGRDRHSLSEGSAGELVQGPSIAGRSSKRRRMDDRPVEYRESAPMTYAERRPASPVSVVRVMDEYGRHVIRDDGHILFEPPASYRDPDTGIRDRRPRASEVIPYDQAPRIEHGYVREVSLPRLLAATNVGHRTNHVVHVANEPKPHSNPSRPVSHSSLAPRNQSSRIGPVDGGSEDGEVTAQLSSIAPNHRNISNETDNAAERFLNEFQPGEIAEEHAKRAEEAERRNEDALRAKWESERIESMRRMYQPPEEQHQYSYEKYEEQGRPTIMNLPSVSNNRSPEQLSGRSRHERHAPHQYSGLYDYENSYDESAVEGSIPHIRSSEMSDSRHTLNETIYRDERHPFHGPHASAGRVARFETVRVENDRQRPSSPLYVKLGANSNQYREQSPAPRYAQQEPLYRTRTPQPSVQEVSYERVPRPEYYRVYADEPRHRETQHEGQVEYVQVADPKGDYLIRRPVRREPEPIYATFEDAPFTARQSVYEPRTSISRSDPAYYEEYDPRHPAPPPSTTVRQVRYE